MPDSADAFRTTYCPPRRAPRPSQRRWIAGALLLALVAALAGGLR